MADDTVNTSKADSENPELLPQTQPISTVLEGMTQASQPVDDGQRQQEWSNAPLLKTEELHNTTFQGAPKQQSETAAHIEERKERGLPGSNSKDEKGDIGGQHQRFFQQELGAAPRRNYTTCSDEEGSYSLGPSTEKDLVGNLLTPSNEDLQPVTEDDTDVQNQINMFTGSDQHQQPTGDQELKLKKAQVKNHESENNILSEELATKAAAQIIEYGTESGSRQLSISEQQITYGDTDQDQISKMFDTQPIVSQETDPDAHKAELRSKKQETVEEVADQQREEIDVLSDRSDGDQLSEGNNAQILDSTNFASEKTQYRTQSVPENFTDGLPQENDESETNSALKPEEEENKYSGQKLDGLGISKQRSKSMINDEPPTSVDQSASTKKQKKRVPFLRLFTKRSNSRDVDVSMPQETSEKKEDEVPQEKEPSIPAEQQPNQITGGKQKDKKQGSRFFDLFRSKHKKSKAKRDSDAKLEQDEQHDDSPEQLAQQPPGSNEANDLDEGFRDSQDGSGEAEEEQLPTKLEKADFRPFNKGRTSENFQRNSSNANEVLNVMSNYNSNPNARSTVDRKNSNWGSDAASGGGLHSNSFVDENPNQVLYQANNTPVQQQQQLNLDQQLWLQQHAEDNALITTIESECPFSFERTFEDAYNEGRPGRPQSYDRDDHYDFLQQQLQQQPEHWSNQARMSESNSYIGKDEIKTYQFGSQNFSPLNTNNTPNSQWPTAVAHSGDGVSSSSTGNENNKTRTTGSWRGSRGRAQPFMNVSVDQGHQRGRYSNPKPEPASNSIFVHESRSQNDELFNHIAYREQFIDADEKGYSADQHYAGSNSSLSNNPQYNESDRNFNAAINNNFNSINQAYNNSSQPRKTSHDLIASNPSQLSSSDLLPPAYSSCVQGISPHHQPMRNNFTGQPSDFNQQQPSQGQQQFYYNSQQLALVQNQMANFQLDQTNTNTRTSNPFQQNSDFNQQSFQSQQFQPQLQHSFSEVPIVYPQQSIYQNMSQGVGRNSEPTQPQIYQPSQFQPFQQHQQSQQHFIGMQNHNVQGAFFKPQSPHVHQIPANINNLHSPLPQPGNQYQATTPNLPHSYSYLSQPTYTHGKPPLPTLGGNGRNSTPNLQHNNSSHNSINQNQQQKKSVHSEQQHCQSCSCKKSQHSSQSQDIQQTLSTGQKTPLTPFERIKKMIIEEQQTVPNQQQYHSFSSSGVGNPVTLKEMLGYASELCRDQQCSRFIQEQIKSDCSTEDKNAFFAEICKDEEDMLNAAVHASSTNRTGDGLQLPQSLMRDVFGNFVVQMILEYGSQECVDLLYNCIIMQVPELSFDKYGCRVIQKAFEVLSVHRQGQLISKLDQQMLVKCMFNTQGNHVIQKIITKVPHNMTYFIVELARAQIVQLCKDENGCRIVQRIMERFPRSQIKFITDKILSMITELTTHEFGNYVISHILEQGTVEEQCLIIDEIIDDIVPHSLHKFGSNVIEKCIQYAPDCRKGMILDRIVGVQVANSEFSLAKMIDNEFANYVVQSAFGIASDQNRSILIQKIQQVIHGGHINPKKGYAKHVLSKLEQKYRISFSTQQAQTPQEFSKHMEESKGHRIGSGRHHPPSGQSSRHSQSSQGSMNSNPGAGTNKGRKPQANPHGQQYAPFMQKQSSINDERETEAPQKQSPGPLDQQPHSQSQRKKKNNRNNRKNNAAQQQSGKK